MLDTEEAEARLVSLCLRQVNSLQKREFVYETHIGTSLFTVYGPESQ